MNVEVLFHVHDVFILLICEVMTSFLMVLRRRVVNGTRLFRVAFTDFSKMAKTPTFATTLSLDGARGRR